jgi:hypothetical protein
MKESFEQASNAPITDTLEKEGLSDIILLAERVELVGLQKEKNDILQWVNRQVQNMAEGEDVEGYSRHDTTYVVDGDMETGLPDGKMAEVTLGDILTDGEWEINYTLERGVSSDIKKQYVAAEAMRYLERLLDKQIGQEKISKEIPETASKDKKLHMEHIKAAYTAALHLEKDNLPTGIIAEKMLETYFKKFEIDNHSPFTFQKSDIRRDVEEKIDFVLHKEAGALGVEAQEPTERKDVGVQFTTNSDRQTQKDKMRQIKTSKRNFGLEDIDDIVLVTLPLTETRDLYKQWLEEGKLPGGPAKLWKKETEEDVFRKILGNIFEREQLDIMWNNRV